MSSPISNVKIAAYILGGLLFFLLGCQAAAPEVGRQPAIGEAGAETTATPTQSQGEVALLTVSPTPTGASAEAQPPASEGTPTPAPMPIPTPKYGPFIYHTVSAGQSLGYIALLHQTEIERIVAMNDLSGPEALIYIGQTLRVPVQIKRTAPVQQLLPDSEVVYSPSFVDFDLDSFVAGQGGYLARYEEFVDGAPLTGAQIVGRVAEQFSVGPRLLLALLEYYGGWVTNPAPTEAQLQAPLGPHNPRGGSLYRALAFTANRINAGYYSYKRDGFWIFELPDGSRAITPPGINAGTVGVQNILAIHSSWAGWQEALGPEGLLATYRALFGDPAAYEFTPVVPISLTQPPLSLPWQEGQGFYLTSGPHGGYVDGSAWAAIDFGPPDVLGNCFYSNEPVTAAAAGTIVSARQGEVQIDLDGDGQIQTGWVLLYLHVALDAAAPVQVGQRVAAGDVIGYASCEGGLSNSSHLHFARRYNGEWIEAGGVVPLTLSGWVVQPNLSPYEGKMAKGGQVREACECWEPDLNLIVNEGPP